MEKMTKTTIKITYGKMVNERNIKITNEEDEKEEHDQNP
jgi:hypothetical protein